MRAFRPKLTYANVVSTLCLFIVLGGGAWAATRLPKNSVGTPQLKKNAVTGAKVKNGSLTGADIDAATLGRVPQAASAESATNASHATSADSAGHANSAGTADHAASADTATQAGDAATLDGNRPSAFYPAGGIQRIDANPVHEGPEVTIYSADGLVLTAICTSAVIPMETSLNVNATATAPGARIDSGGVRRLGSTSEPVLAENGLGASPVNVWSTGAGNGGADGQAVASLVYTDEERSIDITLETRVTPTSECQLSGTAAVSG